MNAGRYTFDGRDGIQLLFRRVPADPESGELGEDDAVIRLHEDFALSFTVIAGVNVREPG